MRWTSFEKRKALACDHKKLRVYRPDDSVAGRGKRSVGATRGGLEGNQYVRQTFYRYAAVGFPDKPKWARELETGKRPENSLAQTDGEQVFPSQQGGQTSCKTACLGGSLNQIPASATSTVD